MPSRRSLSQHLTKGMVVLSLVANATGCLLDWNREPSETKDRSSVTERDAGDAEARPDAATKPTKTENTGPERMDGSIDPSRDATLDGGMLDGGALDSGELEGDSGCGTKCPPVDPCASGACPELCNGCLIGNVCYQAGQKNPANECEICHPPTSNSSWQQPSGSACGDQTSSECNLPDSCSFGVCRSNFLATTFTCGGAPAACHEQDMCDGNGRCADMGFKLAGRMCGNQSATDCDLADACDGKGVCKPNYAPLNAPCNSPGECEVQDRCDGAGKCSDKGFKEPGSSCGNGGGNECDLPDECDDAGRCDSNPTPINYVCDDKDPCTGNDRCTGTGLCRGVRTCG